MGELSELTPSSCVVPHSTGIPSWTENVEWIIRLVLTLRWSGLNGIEGDGLLAYPNSDLLKLGAGDFHDPLAVRLSVKLGKRNDSNSLYCKRSNSASHIPAVSGQIQLIAIDGNFVQSVNKRHLSNARDLPWTKR